MFVRSRAQLFLTGGSSEGLWIAQDCSDLGKLHDFCRNVVQPSRIVLKLWNIARHCFEFFDFVQLPTSFINFNYLLRKSGNCCEFITISSSHAND